MSERETFVMEGYFKVSTYAKFSEISLNTAWQRVLRGSVESIIGKDGCRYVYFNSIDMDRDMNGFISLKDYGIAHNIKRSTLLARIRSGLIKPPDIKKYERKWYIRKDYIATDVSSLRYTRAVGSQQNKPNGYLTVKEWSSKNGINLETARTYARLGKIESIEVKGYRYISKDTILSVRPYSKRLLKGE